MNVPGHTQTVDILSTYTLLWPIVFVGSAWTNILTL